MKNARFIFLVVALGALCAFQGCMTVKVSELRSVDAKSFPLGDSVSIGSSGAIHLYSPGLVNTDFMPAGIILTIDGKRVFIDPVGVRGTGKADYILVTHGHEDHFSPAEIERLTNEDTKIYCPEYLAKKIGGKRVVGLRPGDRFPIGRYECRAVFAYNKKPVAFGMYPHTRQDLGFVIDVPGGSVYYTGDTDVIPEMRDISGIGTIILPIPEDGAGLTMSMKDAAEYVNSLNPKNAIAVHYNLGQDAAGKFRALVDASIHVLSFE